MNRYISCTLLSVALSLWTGATAEGRGFGGFRFSGGGYRSFGGDEFGGERAAWTAATWPALSTWCDITAAPVVYNYGDTVIYQDNNVYLNGTDVGTAQDYAQQAITLADHGQKAKAPKDQEWKPLGVFALVQGDEKTSNNIFQLAVNNGGIIRGNYYDGLMDTTTEVYGEVDRKTQRAAWTIGKKNDRVFEAGIYDLTKGETPVLVHLGTARTQQWLLVRVEQPSDSK
jgi:hypothetical protein